jgi:rRNA processing protein Krr1/Pno1
MRALEPDKPIEVSYEIHITIDVPDRYVEIVEVHQSIETGSVLIQVVLIKAIETHTDPERNLTISFRSLES